MKFRFELDPIDEIEPWGDGDARKLHWFGLTSGHYWISTPLGDALRYTDARVRSRNLRSPYVDYQVARLFEDLQSILPFVLEPVPSDIAAAVADAGWRNKLEKWIADSHPQEERMEHYYEAVEWYGERSLDILYLNNGPLFHIWRTEESISVRWEQIASDSPDVWTLPSGEFATSMSLFKSTAYEFLDQVIEAMRKRVEGIRANGWHRDDCVVDIPTLLAEQNQRAAKLEEAKQRCASTDWETVRSAMRHLPSQFFRQVP